MADLAPKHEWRALGRGHPIHSDGNIWIFHRCFNTVPPGSATCIGRGEANPPILQFDPSGKLLKAFGAGMFGYPHGFTVGRDGSLWVSDVNDSDTVLGMPARNAAGMVFGQEVLKLDQNGNVLMMLGKMGVGGSGSDAFDRPTGVAVASNGDIFVSDGHSPNKSNNGRVLKFSSDGRFIKTWGHKGSAPGDFDDPHDIFVGGSLGRVYVADRRNSRIQIFDQDGNIITAWHQFGQPSSDLCRIGRHAVCRCRIPRRVDTSQRRGATAAKRAARHRGRQRHRRFVARLYSRSDRSENCRPRHFGIGDRG